MFVLPAPANLDGLTATGTGPGLPARYYRSAAEAVKTEISFENTLHNDFRLSVLPNPANLEGVATLVASRSPLARLHCHATGTLKTVFSVDNALDNGCHFRYSPASWPYSIRRPDVNCSDRARNPSRDATVESHPSQKARPWSTRLLHGERRRRRHILPFDEQFSLGAAGARQRDLEGFERS
jgi:hypothetical protein